MKIETRPHISLTSIAACVTNIWKHPTTGHVMIESRRVGDPNFFDGTVPVSIYTFNGTISQKEMDDFEKAFKSSMRRGSNAYRAVILPD